MAKRRTHSTEFKKKVIEWRNEHDATYEQTSVKFDVSPSLLHKWQKKFGKDLGVGSLETIDPTQQNFLDDAKEQNETRIEEVNEQMAVENENRDLILRVEDKLKLEIESLKNQVNKLQTQKENLKGTIKTLLEDD